MASSALVEELKKFVLENPEHVFENSADGILVLDTEGRFVLVSKAVEIVSGYSRDELAGKKFFQVGLLTLKSKAVAVEHFLARMAGKTQEPYEIEALSKAGDKLYYEVNASPIRKNGRIIGDYVILRDLTMRRKMEAEIKKTAKKLKDLIALISEHLHIEVRSLQSLLSDAEKNAKEPNTKEKIKRALREAENIDKTVQEMIERSSE